MLRYLELTAEVDHTDGVNYIVDLTFGIQGSGLAKTDITLAGVAPLPQPGNIADPGRHPVSARRAAARARAGHVRRAPVRLARAARRRGPEHGWALLKFCNAIGPMFQLVEDLVRDTPKGPAGRC